MQETDHLKPIYQLLKPQKQAAYHKTRLKLHRMTHCQTRQLQLNKYQYITKRLLIMEIF